MACYISKSETGSALKRGEKFEFCSHKRNQETSTRLNESYHYSNREGYSNL